MTPTNFDSTEALQLAVIGDRSPDLPPQPSSDAANTPPPFTVDQSQSQSPQQQPTSPSRPNAEQLAMRQQMKAMKDTANRKQLWRTINNIIAGNGRKWEEKNPKVGKEFRAALYKLLYDYQMRVNRVA